MKSIQTYNYSRFNHTDKKSKINLNLALLLFFGLLVSSTLTYAEPIRPSFNSNTLAPNDDESTELVDLGFPINFFGTTFNQGFVNNNGNMTFDSALSEFTPFGLLNSERIIIAPFFADVDTEVSGSSPVTYGQGILGSRPAFAVNWVNVACFSTTDGGLNSFQMIIIDRSDIGEGDFDIEFNYQAIDWESGTASDGNEVCEEGSPARIGYSNGTTTSFELAGSGEAGAFLDTNLDTGLIHNSRNSLVSGRYVFEVRNGVAPTGNHIAGTIFGNDINNPLAAALIQICTTGQDIQCNLTRSNTLGQYQIDALNQATYEVRAFPPAGTDFQPATIGPISLAGVDLNNQDIILQEPQPLPDDTTISPSRDRGNEPIVYWGDPLDLTTQACSGGNASFTLTHDDGSILASGIMQEDPTNSGTYTATIPPLSPVGGHAIVSIEIICPDGTTEDIIFSIYIDPSGIVQDTFGNPVSNATVTLYRSDSSAGPFEQVADGSDIMSPSNRTNPDLSTEQGLFGWDVITGFYTVRAEAEGCTSPNTELNIDNVETEVLTIPPPVTDLELVLDCGSIFVPNIAPVSEDDMPDPIDSGQSIVIDVLDNDSDSDGLLALDSVIIVTQPTSGEVEVDLSTGTVTYIHNGSLTTNDSFTYTVEDDDGDLSNIATVTININEVIIPNIAPTAEDDIVSPINSGQSVLIDVLDNDSDSDGLLAQDSVTIDTQPANGEVEVDLNTGEVTYIHDGSSTTSDSFTYTVEDDDGEVSNIAAVLISITTDIASCGMGVELDGNNDWVNIPNLTLAGDFTFEGWVKLAPGIDNKDALFGQEGSGPDFNFYQGKPRLYAFGDHVIASTVLLADNWYHIAITRSGINLTLYINGVEDATGRWNGKLNLKAIGRGNRGYFGGMLDEIRVWDVARSAAEINANFDTTITPDSLGLIGYWSFNDSDQTVIDSSNSTNDGSLGINTNDGTDDPLYQSSTAPFIEDCDGEGAGGNEEPVASNDTASVQRGKMTTINVLANDGDSDGSLEASTVSIVSAPSEGIVEINNDGTIVYTNNANSTEITDTLSYTVNDNEGAISNVATVTITITDQEPQNEAPIANNDIATVQRGEMVTINVLVNDIDNDGSLEPSSVFITSEPSEGMATFNDDGTITYTNYEDSIAATDTLSYTVQDNEGEVSNTATATITITGQEPQNEAPVANNDNASVQRGEMVTINVLANDDDSDGNLIKDSLTIVNVPTYGSTEINFDTGQVTYTHNSSASSNDTFIYTVEDDDGAVSNEVTVTVSITDTPASCGTAIELDGANDWVNIPDVSLDNDFTIEGWFKLAPGIDYKDGLFGQEGFGPDVHFSAGRVRLYAYGIRVTANTPLVANTWGHIAITRSGTNLTVYINGVKDATGRWNGKLSLKAIGRGNRGFFKGMMDEIRIWNVARSDAEINASFDTHVVPNTSGLIGYWSFDDSDQTVIDSSNSANHGSLGMNTTIGTDDPLYQSSTAPFSENCE